MTSLAAIFELARAQHGVLTRAQLSEGGVTRARLRTLVGNGVLVRAGRQTLVVAGAPSDPLQRVAIACFDTGGYASHRTAAWLHSIRGFQAPRVPEVSVGRHSYSYDNPQVNLHTSTNLTEDDLVTVAGIPCLSVARTLFSLASLVPIIPSARVKGAVDDAVAARLAHDPWLWARLEAIRCRGRNGVRVFEQVLVERSGGAVTESWLERETLRVLANAGLPTPICQARIAPKGAFVARVDFLYPDHLVVIEVNGHAWHSTRDQVAADAARRRQLVLAGYLVLDFTYDDIVSSPQLVVTQVRAALVARTRNAA